MIGKKEVIDAVAAVLRSKWPDRDVYRNLCPTQFTRPSLLIEAPKTSRRDASAGLIEETVYLTVVCYGTLDVNQNSDADELEQTQNDVINLFRTGYLRVLDRAVKFTASEGGMDFDRAWVDLQCSYHDRRSEEPVLPMMREIDVQATQ